MKHRKGFTLIELMITVAIVAILAAVAYPTYRSYVMRSNRVEAQNALLQIQVAQEKFFLQHNRYATTNTELTNAPGDATPGLGMRSTTEHGYYTLSLAPGPGGSVNGYTATATATGGQAQDTDCPTFSITHTGVRSPSTGCWK